VNGNGSALTLDTSGFHRRLQCLLRQTQLSHLARLCQWISARHTIPQIPSQVTLTTSRNLQPDSRVTIAPSPTDTSNALNAVSVQIREATYAGPRPPRPTAGLVQPVFRRRLWWRVRPGRCRRERWRIRSRFLRRVASAPNAKNLLAWVRGHVRL